MRQILHIDINSFYASCEKAIDKTLQDKPVVVVSTLNSRNCIPLAVSYEARKLGIVRNMSIRQVLQICPDIIVKEANYKMYNDFSNQFLNILYEYAPVVEAVSIDEAYLDMSGTERLYGDIKSFAKRLQERILHDLMLPTSIGIADNKLLAKMGSDYKKPMGITELYSKNVKTLVWPLSVEKLWGVGSKTLKTLQNIGVYTIGELAKFDTLQLKIYFGEKGALTLYEFANGRDDSKVVPYDKYSAKSIGKEITFEEDVLDQGIITKSLLEMSEIVSTSLRRICKKAKTITLKIKYNNFTVVNRSRTLDRTFTTPDIIYKTAVELYKKECVKTVPIRLVGVQVSNLYEGECEQMNLFVMENDKKNEKLAKAIDEIREKYGYGSIKRAGV